MPHGPPLTTAGAPNDVWCADFKGQFRLGSGTYCYPLTITDRYTRFVIKVEALEGTHLEPAMAVFEQAFRERGLPKVIRTDNGMPFAAPGLWGLTRLAVRWLRLGVWPERIAPAHPEQNGQHERMHLVLKQETTRPPGKNILQQQERFDRFVDEYNYERPHEALGMRRPGQLYENAERPYPKELPELEYPTHDVVRSVRQNGDVHLTKRERFFLSTALRDQRVGCREIDDGSWLVSFMQLDLGIYDARSRKFAALGAVTETEQEEQRSGIE
jgi:hypothetical protein